MPGVAQTTIKTVDMKDLFQNYIQSAGLQKFNCKESLMHTDPGH